MLIESCRKAIESGRCLGCQALEDKNFTGNPNCRFGKTPTAQESINKIFKYLGVDKNVKNSST